MKIAPAAWPLLVPIAVFLLLAAGVCWRLNPVLGVAVGVAGGVFFGWAVWFFRDPDRTIPTAPGLVISPADGRVIKIDSAPLPKEVSEGEPPMQRVAIFLNLFNVHVNRVPCAGTIMKTSYVPGRFLNASLDKASEHNERSAAVLRTDDGATIGFVQIAGLVARRIVNTLKTGDRVERGQRFGLIRFGSRAEIYLPPGSSVQVKVGDHVIAGESVIARLNAGGPGAHT